MTNNNSEIISERQLIVADIFYKIWKYWTPAIKISKLLKRYAITDDQLDEYIRLLKEAKDKVDVQEFQSQLALIIDRVEKVKHLEAESRKQELLEIREIMEMFKEIYI